MKAVRPPWLQKRNRGIHMTIRDIDCDAFDVEAMMQTYAEWHVTFFSFFAAGYVTTYPTELELQRISPWLGDRDLTGEIIETAHRYGIKAIPMIDLGQLPEAAYLAHPEWAARDAEGRPVPATADGTLYRACPLGGYIREYCRKMVAELVQRYTLDAVKFGGGSYGFGATVCHCPACREQYPADSGQPLPEGEDWNDPAWQTYHRWKGERTAETVRHLVDLVHDLAPDVPVVGNAVCFGDPSWTLRSSLDIEELAEIEDIVQVEVQSRFRYDPQRDNGAWQYLRWPSETARYMTAVSDRPIWTVCSYFMAWPWRRNAVPAAEQAVYLAQMAANGATPMVNLSGGPPKVHEDQRGFDAIKRIYGFMAAHADLYEDRSAATVALVYSQESLEHHGDQAYQEYVNEMRGFELALDEAHIPYDIISCRVLEAAAENSALLARYKALVLPGAVALSDKVAETLRALVVGGGGLIADFDCSFRTEDGRRRDKPALAELLGVVPTDEPQPAVGHPQELLQVYMRRTGTHPITDSAADIDLLPLPGRFVPVETLPDTTVPLRRTAPFRVFPEGWAYTTEQDPGEPIAVAREHGEGAASGGRTVYFSLPIGKAHFMLHHPTLGDLIADATRWVLKDDVPLKIEAPGTLQTSLRRVGETLTVHCVNLTGGERFMRQIVPLRECRIGMRHSDGESIPQAVQVSSGETLSVDVSDGWAWVTVPELGEYDVILFEQ